MGYIIIAPVGDNLKALFAGIKEFPTEKVILISPSPYYKDAQKLGKRLEEFTIPSEIIEIKGNMLEEMFAAFSRICSLYGHDSIIVNVATGDRMSTCAALSAAYANGLKAFGVSGNSVMLMPIMKLSYYQELSANKMRILMKMGREYVSIKDLARKLDMSVSLLSYHISGNFRHKGLKEYRLVEANEQNNSVMIRLSSLGSLLLNGYLQQRKGGM